MKEQIDFNNSRIDTSHTMHDDYGPICPPCVEGKNDNPRRRDRWIL